MNLGFDYLGLRGRGAPQIPLRFLRTRSTTGTQAAGPATRPAARPPGRAPAPAAFAAKVNAWAAMRGDGGEHTAVRGLR